MNNDYLCVCNYQYPVISIPVNISASVTCIVKHGVIIVFLPYSEPAPRPSVVGRLRCLSLLFAWSAPIILSLIWADIDRAVQACPISSWTQRVEEGVTFQPLTRLDVSKEVTCKCLVSS